MGTEFSFLFVLISCCILLLTISSISADNPGAFSVELIHRDSPLSPFYNPKENSSERVQKAIQRSINRVNYLKHPLPISNDTNGDYLMKYQLGIPSHEILGIADTGSNFTWTQCLPCENCYQQIAPIFDPSNSSTYEDISCSSRLCEALGGAAYCDLTCKYTTCTYIDDSKQTICNVAADTLKLNSTNGQPVNLHGIVFGCFHDNRVTLGEESTNLGIVGLGRGPMSMVSQLGTYVDNKFSYCLTPPSTSVSKNETIKFTFGGVAEISGGEGVVSTPLVRKKKNPSLYYLTLEALSVNGKIIPVRSRSVGSKKEVGNIIIDSGTTLNFLPKKVLEKFELAVRNAIHLEPVSSPSHDHLKLCYSLKELTKIPTIKAHFTGAEIALRYVNAFLEFKEDGVSCLAFSQSSKLSIFGNVSQRDFIVEYDIKGEKVSFKPTDCTNCK